MSNLAKRLDELKKHIQTEEYLTGKGLSNEVNISIFCYEPKDEMEVRDFTEKLVNDVTLKLKQGKVWNFGIKKTIKV